MSECKTCQVLEYVLQRCIYCACEMHDQCMSKHSQAKCVKHTTNGQYMINMHNHGSPQNWYSSESKTENFI